MNERIEEFAEQARLHAKEIYPEVKDIKAWGRVYHEKFAELIVRECAGICEKDKKGFPDSDSVKQGLADMIKQHFGVEE